MQVFESSVSPKGQITLPVAVRRRLGIKPKDKVIIQWDGDVVTVARPAADLDTIYQSVPPLDRCLTTEEMAGIAAEEHAQHAAREGLSQR